MVMRCLTMCNGGNVRSVTLARMLRKRGHEAIAAGCDSDWSLGTIIMLTNWADVIYIMGDDSLRKLHRRMDVAEVSTVQVGMIESKISQQYKVGFDAWVVPQHPDLLRRLRDMVEADPPR